MNFEEGRSSVWRELSAHFLHHCPLSAQLAAALSLASKPLALQALKGLCQPPLSPFLPSPYLFTPLPLHFSISSGQPQCPVDTNHMPVCAMGYDLKAPFQAHKPTLAWTFFPWPSPCFSLPSFSFRTLWCSGIPMVLGSNWAFLYAVHAF